MMRLAKSLCLLLVGVVLGWWLNELTPRPQTGTVTSVIAPTEQPTRSQPENSLVPREPYSQQVSESTATPNANDFRLLLTGQEFEEVLAYYEHALSLNDDYQLLLKPVLEQYLKDCLEHCRDGVFVKLVDIWLAAYYQDIAVLLLLAEHQRLQGQPEEAASTLQLATTYAWQTKHQEDVSAAVQQLVMTTDETLSRQENWIELLGFYEHLENIDLGTPEFLLREAILYRVLGEDNHSRALILQLRARDNQLNSEWTAALDEQLSLSSSQPETDSRPGYAIAVTALGNHFLAEATLNGMIGVNLLIDTGASLTTLSQASFNGIPKGSFQYRGSHMFNTANGLTQGDIYRAASIELGDIQLNDIDIAVLEYSSAPGVDGLLGMNVLRHYRFEIDTEGSVLNLQPR